MDARSLEWVGILFLSQDQVGIREIIESFERDISIHDTNKERFKLPTKLIAKTFVFRLVYGGSAYAYSVDADFESVGYSAKKWQSVIDEFYTKYSGIKACHDRWVAEAIATGQLVLPTGREYRFTPSRDRNGELKWPRTKILNYPVQGLGADLMAITRVLIKKYLDEANIKAVLINTVHDSIDVDCPDEEVNTVIEIYKRAFRNVPAVFEANFGVPFNVPYLGEIHVGKNLKDLEKIA